MATETPDVVLLRQIIQGQPYVGALELLANMNKLELEALLNSGAAKKAFWLNIHNAYCLKQFKSGEGSVVTQQERQLFFGRKGITLAGQALSLDNIRNSLLRKSFGPPTCWFKAVYGTSNFEKKFRIEQPADPRVFLALYCASPNCPQVDIYHTETLETQLEDTVTFFARATSNYYPEENLLTISQVFRWYMRDFGGEAAIINLLREKNIIPADTVSPLVIYKVFNWEKVVEV